MRKAPSASPTTPPADAATPDNEVKPATQAGAKLVVETALNRDQYIQLTLTRHFQRTGFFFAAFTSAAVAAYAISTNFTMLLLFAFTPVIMYSVFGFVMTYRDAKLHTVPFLPTRYEFSDKGVHVSTSEGASQLYWGDFKAWRDMADCYVLVLNAGAILAIPQRSVPPRKRAELEGLLHNRITALR